MAFSAIKTEEEKKEFFDDPDVLEEKVSQLAEWVRESTFTTAFTGAGISTSTGIPDYRSGYGTVLQTGPGCWEKAAAKEQYKKDLKNAGKQLPNAYKVSFNTTISQARPSKTHMALVELMNRDMLRSVVSQNIDGLHRKSGIDPNKLADLHGNHNLEICAKCGREHMRDYRVRTSSKVHSHETGRFCETPGCRGKLEDTIINFGEDLNIDIMSKGYRECAQSDLCICMGSSMRIPPARDMPLCCIPFGGKVVMINLQKTPIDVCAALIIHERVDVVIEMLMKKLEIPIPDFRRYHRLKVSLSKDNKQVSMTGVDSNGSVYTIFTKLVVKGMGPSQSAFPQNSRQVQPYNLAVPNP